MLRNPRVWLFAGGGWLILGGIGHTFVHVVTFVLEQGLEGQRDFAVRAMKAAISLAPLRPNMWTLFRTFSVAFALLLFFAGTADVLLAWLDAPPRVLKAFALLGTVFWTVAFVPFAFIDPVLHPIVIAAVAVPLHGMAWLAADQQRELDGG